MDIAEIIAIVRASQLTLEEMVDAVFDGAYQLEATEHRPPTQRDRFQWIAEAQVQNTVKRLSDEL